uniref:Uncharacterized protein n=1 Tax=Rhizophora mucronata TaxID=61149 RepID=A0A2P2QSV5_RHIMU
MLPSLKRRNGIADKSGSFPAANGGDLLSRTALRFRNFTAGNQTPIFKAANIIHSRGGGDY